MALVQAGSDGLDWYDNAIETNHIFGMVPGDDFHYCHLTSVLHLDNESERIRLDRLGA